MSVYSHDVAKTSWREFFRRSKVPHFEVLVLITRFLSSLIIIRVLFFLLFGFNKGAQEQKGQKGITQEPRLPGLCIEPLHLPQLRTTRVPVKDTSGMSGTARPTNHTMNCSPQSAGHILHSLAPAVTPSCSGPRDLI